MRRLRERIQSMIYERTALSRKPEETIAHDLALVGQEGQMTPDLAFRDPYMLDFLGLADSYSLYRDLVMPGLTRHTGENLTLWRSYWFRPSSE